MKTLTTETMLVHVTITTHQRALVIALNNKLEAKIAQMLETLEMNEGYWNLKQKPENLLHCFGSQNDTDTVFVQFNHIGYFCAEKMKNPECSDFVVKEIAKIFCHDWEHCGSKCIILYVPEQVMERNKASFLGIYDLDKIKELLKQKEK